MIYAISDIHGCIEELQKQMEQVELSGDNRIIFLGDYIDYGDSSYQVLKYIWDLQKEYGEEKVVVLKGNHENFAQLNSYSVDTWNGGKVHFVENRIIHLMRGQVFEIDATRFFTFGGAYSIDKIYRTEGLSWFPEEIPNRKEYEEGWHNLEKVDFQVDYILTHSGPREVVAAMGY